MDRPNLSDTLARLTATARQIDRRPDSPRSEEMLAAEERRMQELLEHLPMEMIDAAKAQEYRFKQLSRVAKLALCGL